jgi:hypothetical protein
MLRDRIQFTPLIAVAAVIFAICGATCSPAQESEEPPLYGGVQVHVRGVFVTPVAGSPFTATTLIESRMPLPDGTVEIKRTLNKIARDSRGRIHNERRRLEPESFHGTPPLLETHIYDPQTHANTFFVTNSRLARVSILPNPPVNPALASRPGFANIPGWKEEDLGTTTLNGLTARGLRRTHTVSAKASGTNKPIDVVDEYWYSEDLRLNLLVRHSDPRTGVQTVAVSDIKREEPAATLFEIPAGFKTVDVTPPGR